MINAVETLRDINFQHVWRPKFDALKDRSDGIPTGTPWAKAIGVGRQFGFPLWLQSLAYERLPRPFVLGRNPKRTPLRAAPFGHPGASKRGSFVIETEHASESPSLGRWERFHPSDARGVFPPVVLGHPTHRSQPCIPGLTQQVLELTHCSDISTWRGSVHSLVEVEDISLDFLPGNIRPGRHQGLALLCVGSWPLTHHCTFQDTGPTSAYPGHDPWPWLLRASSSPVAYGGCLLHEVTASQRAAGGYAVPSSHGLHP
jgi:hypothetical protein